MGISGNFDVYLLRSIKKGGQIQDEVVAVSEQNRKQTSSFRSETMARLKNMDDKELGLGFLAELTDEYLAFYSGKQQGSSKAAKNKPKIKKVGKV